MAEHTYTMRHVFRYPSGRPTQEDLVWVHGGRAFVGVDVAWRSVGVSVITETGTLGFCGHCIVPDKVRGNRSEEGYYLYRELASMLTDVAQVYDVCGVGVEDPSFLAAKLRGMTIQQMRGAKSVPTQNSIMLVAGGIGIARAAIGQVASLEYGRDGAGDWRYYDISPTRARAEFNRGLTVPNSAVSFVQENIKLAGVKRSMAEAVVARLGELPDSEHCIDAAVVAWYVRQARIGAIEHIVKARKGRTNAKGKAKG